MSGVTLHSTSAASGVTLHSTSAASGVTLHSTSAASGVTLQQLGSILRYSLWVRYGTMSLYLRLRLHFILLCLNVLSIILDQFTFITYSICCSFEPMF